MMQRPIQKAEKLPATKPDKMFNEAPPCLEPGVGDFADVPGGLVLTGILW